MSRMLRSGSSLPRRVNRGQSLVEFALVLPLVLGLLMITFDAGRLMFIYSVVSNAAKEGARAGVVISATDDRIRAAVTSSTLNLAPTVNISPTGNRNQGDMLEVTVSYTFQPAPYLYTGPGIPLSGTARMRVE